jgi:hypothetical protein
MGWGGGASISLGNSFALSVSARLPVGLNLYFLDNFEIFLQAVPSLGLTIPLDLYWYVPVNLGLRYWI